MDLESLALKVVESDSSTHESRRCTNVEEEVFFKAQIFANRRCFGYRVSGVAPVGSW